jgi:hypothetical protein
MISPPENGTSDSALKPNRRSLRSYSNANYLIRTMIVKYSVIAVTQKPAPLQSHKDAASKILAPLNVVCGALA